jgi:hypothetical protein
MSDDVIDTSGVVRMAVNRPDALAAIQEDVMEAERLFIVWMQADDRRATVLAEATGIPVARVRAYLRKGDFQQRYIEETARFRAAAAPYARTRAAELVDSMVDRLGRIVENGEDRDAIAATRVLTGMLATNDDGVETRSVHIDVRVLEAAGKIVQSGELTPEDGTRMLRAALAQNVDATTDRMTARKS